MANRTGPPVLAARWIDLVQIPPKHRNRNLYGAEGRLLHCIRAHNLRCGRPAWNTALVGRAALLSQRSALPCRRPSCRNRSLFALYAATTARLQRPQAHWSATASTTLRTTWSAERFKVLMNTTVFFLGNSFGPARARAPIPALSAVLAGRLSRCRRELLP